MKKSLLLSVLLFSFNACAQEQDAAAAQGGRWVYQTPINESANDAETCRLKWDRYHRSQECFAPHHMKGGAVKAEGFEHCTEYKSPIECSLQ